MIWVAAVVAALVVIAALSAIVGRYRFKSLVDDDMRVLLAGEPARIGPEQIRARADVLPEPIRRYLHYAIGESAPPVATARLRHGGQFRTSPDQSWWSIAGEEYFTAARPGFVWHATVWPLPIMWIEARDRLFADHGNMLVRAYSVITLADARGPEIDQGSRLRWLAECAWLPHAYAGDAIAWTPIDAQSARATLRGTDMPVSAVVEVDDEGRLTRLRAERYRDIGGGKSVLNAWHGTYTNYREFSGVRVPTSVEVAWELENGSFSYARFTVTTIEYNVRERF